MNKSIKDKSVSCPGCGQVIVLDKLKKHLKRDHRFQEPFSLSQAIFPLSNGNITASDLYSHANLEIPAKEHDRLEEHAQIIAVFDSRDEGDAWWNRLEKLRGFTPKPVKITKPVPKRKKTSEGKTKFLPNTQNRGIVRCSVCGSPAIPGDNLCAMHAKQ